jgi:hypothetical protein
MYGVPKAGDMHEEVVQEKGKTRVFEDVLILYKGTTPKFSGCPQYLDEEKESH